MTKTISMRNFYSSDVLTAILTYAFLKNKEHAGYILTDDEKDLLYNKKHNTIMSMAFNNNGYYPLRGIPGGFQTLLDLEAYVRNMIFFELQKLEGQGLFMEYCIQNILNEALSMIPEGTIITQDVGTVQMNTVKFSDDKIILVVRINGEFGTIVKGYTYFPPTIEALKKYAPGFAEAYDSNIYRNNRLIFLRDLLYAGGRMIFDNDFEPLFNGEISHVPAVMHDKIVCSLDEFERKITSSWR
ncbi:MAG: hypothetical protein K2J47_08160 [Ruminococcus sp.]|nr:hypothetical protein [Ruminococcus sp.]